MRASKEANAAYFKKWYYANKEEQFERVNRDKEKKKNYVRSYKERPCTDCGVEYPFYVMQFDHLSDKKFSLSEAHMRKGWASIQSELQKCEVVCANCHMARTYTRSHKAGSESQTTN